MRKYTKYFIIVLTLINLMGLMVFLYLSQGTAPHSPETIEKIAHFEASIDSLRQENQILADSNLLLRKQLTDTEKSIQEIDSKLAQNEKIIIRDTASVRFYTDIEQQRFFTNYTRPSTDSTQRK